MTIGELIKKKRKEMGFTLSTLSKRCGLSISFLSDIEHGRRRPSLDRLRDIAVGLETTVSFLLGESHSTLMLEKMESDNQSLYNIESISLEFREVLERIENFDQWSNQDREELLTYLKIKEEKRKRP